jgi:uncharacterized protein (TIRG00374 family)
MATHSDDAPTDVTAPRWQRPLLVVVGLVAFGVALRGAEPGRALDLALAMGPAALLLLLPQGLWNVVHAGAWRELLVTLGHRVSLARLTADYVASEAARKTLPAGVAFGETLGAYLLRQGSGVPVPDAAASLAVKRCLVVMTHGLFGVLALAVGGDTLARTAIGPVSVRTVVAAMTALLFVAGAGMLAAMKRRTLAGGAARLVSRFGGARLRGALEARAAGIDEADERLARPLRSPARLASASLLLLLQWLVEAFESLLLLRLLGVEAAPAAIVATEVAVSFVRSMAFVMPSGLGVQDLGYVAMLQSFGIPEAPTVGATFVVLKRVKELFWIGAGYLLLFAARERGKMGR